MGSFLHPGGAFGFRDAKAIGSVLASSSRGSLLWGAWGLCVSSPEPVMPMKRFKATRRQPGELERLLGSCSCSCSCSGASTTPSTSTRNSCCGAGRMTLCPLPLAA